MKLKPVFQTLTKTIETHSPEILTGAGIIFMVGSVVCAVRATWLSKQVIDDANAELEAEGAVDENGEPAELTPKEKVELVWKNYIWSAVSMGAGIYCTIKATKISIGRTAAATIAYKVSEEMYDDLEASVKKTLGDKKAQTVKENQIREKMDRSSDAPDCEVIDTGNGNTLCYDYWSGRYFLSNAEVIRQAMNVLTARAKADALIDDGIARVSMNDFYDAIGLKDTKSGDILGWRFRVGMGYDDPIPIVIIGAINTKYGSAANTVDFNVKPIYDYDI